MGGTKCFHGSDVFCRPAFCVFADQSGVGGLRGCLTDRAFRGGAILQPYPTRALLADALQRVLAAGIKIDGGGGSWCERGYLPARS